MTNRRQKNFLLVFNLATILLMGWFVLAFLTKGATGVSATLSNLYLLVLGFYTTDKEIDRWKRQYRSNVRRGEYFVVGWSVIGAVMLLVEIFGGAEHGYWVPDNFAFTAGSVIVIYFITAYLKSEFRRRA